MPGPFQPGATKHLGFRATKAGKNALSRIAGQHSQTRPPDAFFGSLPDSCARTSPAIP